MTRAIYSIVRFMTHTTWCVFAAISQCFASRTGWHTGCKFAVKIASTNENPLYICWETVHIFFHGKNPWYIHGENIFMPKTICIYSSHSFWVYKFTTTIGESLINLVHQYPALWDKQDTMYKDSNYKEAEWKEIVEIFHLNKEHVVNKWKSFRDTYVRHKNIKSKSGDGLSQCKLKWKCYDIMSLIDVTLLKWRYVLIYLTTSHIQHTYIQDNYVWFWSDQFSKNCTIR